MKKSLSHLRAMALVLLMVNPSLSLCQQVTPLNVSILKQFITASNAHDSNAMAKLVADDIEWLSVNGEIITVETKGKHDLIKGMNSRKALFAVYITLRQNNKTL